MPDASELDAFLTPLVQIDDEGRLFLSSAILDWEPIHEAGVTVVVDLEGGLDRGVSTRPGHMLYVYFHIYDQDLPQRGRLLAVARLCAQAVAAGDTVLIHCLMGLNRSALVAGMVLRHFGLTGAEAVARLRERRPGALYNDVFAEFLKGLPAAEAVIEDR